MAKNYAINATYGTTATSASAFSAKDIERAMKELKEIDYSRTIANPYLDYKFYNVKPEPTDKGIEEWVWVTGYKGTDKNMKCRDYQYEMGKQHDMPEGSNIEICYSGFHFCDKISDVFRYYRVDNGNRFFEVKALVRRWKKDGTYTIEQNHDKMSAKSIIFTRELTTEEIFKHIIDEPYVANWTYEQKCKAREVGIRVYRDIIKAEELAKLGYSETFATWVVKKGGYTIAKTMGSMPDVSMDVKVLTICTEIYYD